MAKPWRLPNWVINNEEQEIAFVLLSYKKYLSNIRHDKFRH